MAPKEIELKLSLPATEGAQLMAHPVLAGCAAKTYPLYNTYFDTPEFALRDRRIALRLRRKGESLWLMTVKGGESGIGGLAQRSEWEAPTKPGVFDFGIVGDAALREFLLGCQPRLQPVFSTDFQRTAWHIQREGATIELALDQGTLSAVDIAGAGQVNSAPISEIELELIEGASPDVLFDLAIELAADLPLRPEIVSKAERGYALADRAMLRPVKAAPSSVNDSMTPTDAFRAVASACLMQLQRNEAGVIAGRDPEFVHQARVAIRRLRSALKVFAPVLAPAFVAVYAPRWRTLASQLGDARDLDVFLDETLTLLETAFPGEADLVVLREKAEAAKRSVQAQAQNAFAQADYSRLLLAFSAALLRETPPTIERVDKKAVAVTLPDFARRCLDRRAKAVRRLLDEHARMNAERRHQLRIAFKKLRYALDFFAPLFAGKRLAAYQESLASIQDLLGTLNDQQTALRLIREMHPKNEPQPLTRGWLAGRTASLLETLDKELRRFGERRRPWRGKLKTSSAR